ncbi:MAG: type II toxin-antitoxin system RelE/ParE family toxin [Acidobacteria bacterium]|nr:type II toxin-antitoxin system RelE/ParE family toxin [Acidobacteriota bacterium]
MEHRLAPEAENDLDSIWNFVATETGNVDIADRFIDSLIHRFLLLEQQPFMGCSRDENLRPGIRTFPVGEFVIAYRIDGDDVRILRVLRGSQDIEALLGL